MSYEVQVKDLRDSAEAARSAARQVGTITPGSHLRGAGTGMPGAASVAALARVGSAWAIELSEWAEAARGFARTLDTNADQYQLDDGAARDAFSPIGQGH
jgi:hypothetical protein